MTYKNMIASALLGAGLVFGTAAAISPAFALDAEMEAYIGEEPTLFDTPEAAVTAFREAIAAADLVPLAKLLGLDPAKLQAIEGVSDIVQRMRDGAARKLVVEEEEDQRILKIGNVMWPFPFPITYGEDKKWAFDTVAGIEEIVNRRVGENELQAIATARWYVDAQRDYAAEDRDLDGVLEFAQKLISSEGQTDGLFWPAEQGDGESPVGPYIDQAALDKAAEGKGYFGYKFRILTEQGENVAGGAYDYVINGNMIAGFGLVAWPAKYAETGVATFMISHAGIVYEKDLGAETDTLVESIKQFNPDDSWEVVED